MAPDVQFCHPPSSTSLLAAIGVIGSFERAEFRASHRALWSRAAVPCSLVVRFVLRGTGATRAARDEAALRQQVASIEANAHPDYGGGFRDCVAALHGRSLHELLSYVRTHARLPPVLGAPADGS